MLKFYMPEAETDPVKAKWAEMYTRGEFKLIDIDDPLVKELISNPKGKVKFYNINLNNPNYVARLFNWYTEKTTELSPEDSQKELHCRACEKIHVNNSSKYCINCQYYIKELY